MTRKLHPLTHWLHSTLAQRALVYAPATLIDMGGNGRLDALVAPCRVWNANLTHGHDCTALAIPDDAYDVAVSNAVLEHVTDQGKFLLESLRVGRLTAIHWAPAGRAAAACEQFKARMGRGQYKHPCDIPSQQIWQRYGFAAEPFMTISEHLLLLATLHAVFNAQETFDYIAAHGHEPYGWLAERTL